MRTSLSNRGLGGIGRLVVAAAAALGSAVAAEPAAANADGSTTATIDVAVRSVTVSPTAVTYSPCFDDNGTSTGSVLVPPDGACGAGPLTVTNGGAPSNIEVNGSDAVPVDNGTHWVLCGSASPATSCAQGAFTPGQDQYLEQTEHYLASGSPRSGPFLSNSPACDTAFGDPSAPSCAAAPNQATQETLGMTGPSSSTDPSGTFSTVITWTAAP